MQIEMRPGGATVLARRLILAGRLSIVPVGFGRADLFYKRYDAVVKNKRHTDSHDHVKQEPADLRLGEVREEKKPEEFQEVG